VQDTEQKKTNLFYRMGWFGIKSCCYVWAWSECIMVAWYIPSLWYCIVGISLVWRSTVLWVD